VLKNKLTKKQKKRDGEKNRRLYSPKAERPLIHRELLRGGHSWTKTRKRTALQNDEVILKRVAGKLNANRKKDLPAEQGQQDKGWSSAQGLEASLHWGKKDVQGGITEGQTITVLSRDRLRV